MNKKVTGCIVTYNNIRTIGTAVSTLLKYTACDFTLYAVDNGSTDGTVEFLRENFPQVKLIISERNIGFGAGHNSILNQLNSDYHVIINPDIVLRDDVITQMTD